MPKKVFPRPLLYTMCLMTVCDSNAKMPAKIKEDCCLEPVYCLNPQSSLLSRSICQMDDGWATCHILPTFTIHSMVPVSLSPPSYVHRLCTSMYRCTSVRAVSDSM